MHHPPADDGGEGGFMRRLWRTAALVAGGVVAAVLIAVLIGTWRTGAEIAAHVERVRAAARAAMPPDPDAAALAALPAPVRAYLRFTFPDGPPVGVQLVEMEMAGDFRRPRTEGFAPTTASQTVAVGVPALAFAARTPILPGIHARAWDAFADGRMEMKARILGLVTVVDETGSPELDRISLRRWLLESPLYPMALLPGGPVVWQPIDDRHARAVVTFGGQTASLVAAFRPDGSLASFAAEEDGDLTTPYHGSGEHVTREDYQRIGGVMLPMAFTISRAAGGRILPFWRGRVTRIAFRD